MARGPLDVIDGDGGFAFVDVAPDALGHVAAAFAGAEGALVVGVDFEMERHWGGRRRWRIARGGASEVA